MTAPSVGAVFELYERWASHRYDEELTQREHALQTAGLAAASGASEALIAAALLHDAGHLLDLDASGGRRVSSSDLAHEALGARYLAGIFPPAVTGPIALHVSAKRYRCAVDPTYSASLSSGSKRSLELQGGPMPDDEVARFERHPGHADAVQLRGWDDQGKVDGLEVPPLDSYRELLERVAKR